MYRQYPFREQKQREAKVKVKETDPTWSQNWLVPLTVPGAGVLGEGLGFMAKGCGVSF